MPKKLNLEIMKELAASKGGKCLSEEYVNNCTKLLWECDMGHTWKAIPSAIRNAGQWCPECSKEKQQAGNRRRAYTLEDMQNFAKQKGGEFLSITYEGIMTKHQWRCSNGHIWEAAPNDVIRDHWCPECVGKAKWTLPRLQELAAQKGGKLLSEKYKNNKTNMVWQCLEGHKWKANVNSILDGHWCPYCNWFLTENKCRYIFEKALNRKFPKNILNGTKRNFWLDGYSSELRLGFEFNGRQHYEYIDYYHRGNINNFHKQLDRDKQLQNECLFQKINLIIIPHYVASNDCQLIEFIINELEKLKLKTNAIRSIDLNEFYNQTSKLKKLREIAHEKGGEIIEATYEKDLRVTCQCNADHVWTTSSASLIAGHWCPYCATIKSHAAQKLTIDQMKELAEVKEGQCLSEKYINCKTKLTWKCKEGHIWEARPQAVKRGDWCPYCGNVIRLTIEQMRELAESRGGLCLSEEYTNNWTKITWKCNKGHVWEAAPNNIKSQGQWCPVCGKERMKEFQKSRKKPISTMHELAKSKNGKCLSNEYIGAHVKLTWQCEDGHVWEATPHNVRKRTWCPVCARKKKR